MRWTKKGLVLQVRGQHSWMQTHASLPVGLRLQGSVYRVYFASRDSRNRSHVGSVELDLARPTELGALSPDPLLTPGPLGHFDDHGVYPSSLVESDGRLFLFYIGWNPGAVQPLFYSSVGLAVSDDQGATFQKLSRSPILARSEVDPCLVTSPCVLLEDRTWRMWYVSGLRWEERTSGLQSYYHIKYAESNNGIDWVRKGLVCIDIVDGETNIARPCVIHHNGLYKMWYAHDVGYGYRIGYAESTDGYVWQRLDEEVGIEASSSGWDSQAMAYPWVVHDESNWHMLYNGNGFGRDGFGLASAATGAGSADLVRRKDFQRI